MTADQEHPGRACYAAYCRVAGTTWDGRPLPAWEELAPKTREAWVAAAWWREGVDTMPPEHDLDGG